MINIDALFPYITVSNILLIISVLILTLFTAKYYIHMLQLEGYFISQYIPHLFARLRNPKLLFNRQKQKKPLVYTARVIRIFICVGLLCSLLSWLMVFVLPDPCYALTVLLIPLSSVLVLASVYILKPVEKIITLYFINDAKRILASRPDLKIIGITGSYGKTSTKFILSTILSEKYSVLTPPASYNTTLGVVRVIREQLQPDDELFVCEMGSRHIGDIKEICDIVHPQNAIITSIGPQHLDTFGSIDGVKKGKFEIIQSLNGDSYGIFASSNDDIIELYDKTSCKKLIAGFRACDDIRAENIAVSSNGSSFDLIFPDGTKKSCTTSLLGKHNISNILVSAAAAYVYGLTPDQIARGISKITPVEHRLQIVRKSPVTVIDDAFNSSPNGASAALDVLSQFENKKIIITPGFVELGEFEDKYHLEFGKKIADCADMAILVGEKRTSKIFEGIDNKIEVKVVNSLFDATALLNTIAKDGDVVLFENDLPDNYNE